MLTWGLLGPGKGIEWAIDAMAELADLRPAPEYVVAGATHPKVRERTGEAYREMLVERAARLAGERHRSLRRHVSRPRVADRLIQSADLVVLPYDSDDQVTSGVLVDAVAAGRPVVSTAFPHAVELLASGAGIVVPQRDPDALGRGDPYGADRPPTGRVDGGRGPPTGARPVVGVGRRRYEELGHRLAARRPAVVS